GWTRPGRPARTRSTLCSRPTPQLGAWPGRLRAPDADLAHRRRRRADLRARGRPLRRGEGGRHPGVAVLARLRPTDPRVAPRRDGVLDLVDSVRRLCED